MASDGRMRAWLMGLDEWLLREDPDVSESAAAEELASYDDTDADAPEGDAQDAEYDAQAGRHQRPDSDARVCGPTQA